MSEFLFVSCQVGAEKALKADLAQHHPNLKFAFSRPGFVTFKCDGDWDDSQPLKSVFVRTFGRSVGSLKEASDNIDSFVELFPDQEYRHLHVWQRDTRVPGDRRFEPFHTPEALEVGQQIKAATSKFENVAVNRTAKKGDVVADLIMVDSDLWFAGWHQANSIPSRWPGGVPPLHAREDMVSRAYLKMQEALRWSRLPLAEGDVCVELGSSPGGSCQALLERGLHVIGIDPAIMDERVLSHENFTHIRARAADIKRKEFANVRWLISDANIDPISVLESIEDIVTNRRVNLQGMLITLKLLNWSMADSIEEYLARIRSWGFRHVRARQLAFNGREICVLATKNKAQSRLRR